MFVFAHHVIGLSHGAEGARFAVLIEEIIVAILFATAAIRAGARYQSVSDPLLRILFIGVVCLSFGFIFQAIGISIALIWFWEPSVSFRLLIWQCSVIFFLVGGHLVVRHDFREFKEIFGANRYGEIEEQQALIDERRTERAQERDEREERRDDREARADLRAERREARRRHLH